MNKWINDILNLFFPLKCHICGTTLSPGEQFVCSSCIEALPRTGYHRNKDNPMEARFAGHFPFVAATGHFFYSKDSSLAQLIQDMKYRNFPSIGVMLGKLAGKELYVAGFLNEIDVIVPLPMHFLKKASRGYNQTDKIAKGISLATGLPVIDALRMRHRRKSQTYLSGTERLQNAVDLFSTKKSIDLSGKSILLIDDICTTGATMEGAALALIKGFHDIKLYLFTLGVTF